MRGRVLAQLALVVAGADDRAVGRRRPRRRARRRARARARPRRSPAASRLSCVSLGAQLTQSRGSLEVVPELRPADHVAGTGDALRRIRPPVAHARMPHLLPPASPPRLLAVRVLAGAAAAVPRAPRGERSPLPAHVPGEVVVTYRAERAAAHAARSWSATRRAARGRARRTRASRRPSRGVRRQPRRRERQRRTRSPTRPAASRPTRAAAASRGGWQRLQWNFAARYRRQRAGRLGAPDRASGARAAGRDGRRARHRRRLREPRPLPPLAGLLGRPASSTRLRLRRPTTPTPTTTTATARTSPRTIAEATDNAIGADRARLRRDDHAGPRARRATGEGDAAPDRRGHPLRRPPRRADHQPVVRVRRRRHPLGHPELLGAIRYARRARRARRRRLGQRGAAAAVAYPARASDVLSVGATTEHGCPADYSNDGAGLDLVAPGGGADADLLSDPQLPARGERRGRDIFQMTFTGSAPRVRAARRLHGHLDGRPRTSRRPPRW